MTLSSGIALVCLLFALALVFLIALAEVSLATISRVNLRKLSSEGASSASRVERLLNDTERLLATILVARTLSIGGAVAAATMLAVYLGWAPVQLTELLLILAAMLVALQVSGRVLAVQQPQRVAFGVARPMHWLTVLCWPVTWLLLSVAKRSGVQEGPGPRNIFLSEDGLRLLFNLGEEERFIEAEEREMIDSIFRFSETTVGEVMVPRVDVVAIEQTATLHEALDTIVSAGHSRIPVYDDTVDRIVGILYAKDLLSCYRQGAKDINIAKLMRKPYFVPESAMVGDLLEDLQHKKVHLAIVVDEYGGTAGIVTIEDLLEEIVGDIQDEYDQEPALLQRVTNGVYLASGRIDIDDLNRELDVTLVDEDESYTLAGVIFSHLQRVPSVGDTLDLGPVHIEVLDVSENRIGQVRLTLPDAELAQPAPIEPAEEAA